MIDCSLSKRKLYSWIVFLALLQSGIWYGGLANLIPTSLLTQWNRITLVFSVVLIILCITKKRYINTVTVLLILYKVLFLFSTYINGRPLEIVEFSRYLCIILAFEYFEDEMDVIISPVMLIFEILIYYNFITLLSTKPDLYGAYYTALGYDNAAPPYLMVAFMVAICYWIEKRKKLRPILLIVVIHATLLITMVSTGLIAIAVVDILICIYLVKKINFSYFKTYCIYMIVTFAIVVCRIQNIFSFIIVDMLGKDLTFTGRTHDWDLVFSMIPQKLLLGHGIMDQATEKMILGDVYTHNAVLEQLFRGGLLALLLFVMIVYFVSNASKYCDNVAQKKIGFLICVMCGFWVISLTEVIFEGYIFYCGLALFFHFSKFWTQRSGESDIHNYTSI